MFNAFPQSMSPAGSTWISGTPVVVNAVSDFIDNVDSYLGEAVTAAASHMTNALRDAALNHPEWAPYADKVSVEWDTDGFGFFFNGTEADINTMMALEYGRSMGSAPKSVTRKVAIHMEDRAGKLIQQILERELGLA